MGFLKNALIKQVQRHFTAASMRAREQKKKTTSSREMITKQDIADGIRTQARERAQGLIKIVKDCAELVNTTVNPEVFFSRYNLMLEHLESLAGLECTGIFENSHELPSESFLRIESQFGTETNVFLARSFSAAKAHAETLKTENGKKNAVKRYFENMEKYIVHMPGESLEYFDRMKEENMQIP